MSKYYTFGDTKLAEGLGKFNFEVEGLTVHTTEIFNSSASETIPQNPISASNKNTMTKDEFIKKWVPENPTKSSHEILSESKHYRKLDTGFTCSYTSNVPTAVFKGLVGDWGYGHQTYEAIDDAFASIEDLVFLGLDHIGGGSSGGHKFIFISHQYQVVIGVDSMCEDIANCHAYYSYCPSYPVWTSFFLCAIKKFPRPALPTFPEFQLIQQSQNGYCTTTLQIKKDYLDLYPEELAELKEVINRKKCGAVILHGPPGTGKSSLIALLAKQCGKTPFFYMPASLATCMDSPGFMNFMMQRPEVVFVIEDAEAVIQSREGGQNCILSALLNMTDGLLGAGLNQKFILTFNSAVSSIDKAILRPGRLLYFKKFDRLNKKAAQKVALDAGIAQLPGKDDFSLAEIFNQDVAPNEDSKARIGF